MARSDSAESLAAQRHPDLSGTRADSALRIQRLPGLQGLRVTGEVDLGTHAAWDDTLAKLLVDGTPGRLDLSGLSFIDVRGVAALMDVADRLVPDIQLTLYRPPWCLRRLLGTLWPAESTVIVIEDGEAE